MRKLTTNDATISLDVPPEDDRPPGCFEAGVWEQNMHFVPWSKHKSEALAKKAAVRYAKRISATGSDTGGHLSWSGGVRDAESRIVWYSKDGEEQSREGY